MRACKDSKRPSRRSSSGCGFAKPFMARPFFPRRLEVRAPAHPPHLGFFPSVNSCSPLQAGLSAVDGSSSSSSSSGSISAPSMSTASPERPGFLHNGLSVVLAALLSAQMMLCPPPSEAVLSSPNAQIPRSVEAALRRSIPAFNREVGTMQRQLEEVAYLLRIPQRKPWGNMAGDVAASVAMMDNRGLLLAGVPSQQLDQAEQLLGTLGAQLKQLELAVKTQQPDFAGLRTAEALKTLAGLELLQAPGLTFTIPKEYASLPRLVGRATVELTLEKADGSLAFVNSQEGGLSKQGKVYLTLDGYSAPISAGNFAANVLEGLYDNKAIQASYASVIITPGDAARVKPPIPLEILPAGEFDPLYRLPLDVQGGELPVLPLSISGAVAMTHLPDRDSLVSGDEWFVFKFDKQQAGLAGLSFDEGSFGVFGYVTSGMDVIKQLQSGDMIVKAELVAGRERLIQVSGAGGLEATAASASVANS